MKDGSDDYNFISKVCMVLYGMVYMTGKVYMTTVTRLQHFHLENKINIHELHSRS